MNKERRTRIRKVTKNLSACISELESIKDEEDYARSCMPENLEYSEAYEKSEECSDTMEDAITDIQGIADSLEKII